jgi:hypothetical protein
MTTGTYAVSASATVDNPTHYLTNKTIFQKFEQTRLPLERITNGNLSANAGLEHEPLSATCNRIKRYL